MPRGDAREEVLLPAALDLFARHGVSGTSLQMIADELGVTKASIYYHHRRKDSIVLAALAPAFAQIEDLVTRADDIPAGPARRRALVEGLADQALTHRKLYAVLLRDVAVSALIAADTHLATVISALHAGLVPTGGPATTHVRVAMFLSGLVAPATDPVLRDLPDEVLRQGIVEAGVRLLDLDRDCECDHDQDRDLA